jgi:hypothetical protein
MPHPTSWRSIFNIMLPSTPVSSKWSLSLKFSYQKPACTYPLPMRATCPAQHVLHDLIFRIIFGDEYRSFSSSLYNSFHSPVIPSLLGPNILLSTLSHAPTAYVLPSMSGTKFHTHIQQAELHFCIS